MDEQAIREAITRLDGAVPRLDARVELTQYGGGPDESRIVANRRGYLRMGIELLKAAYAEPPAEARGDDHLVRIDLDYLLTPRSTIRFDDCQRREPDAADAAMPDAIDRFVPWLIFGGLFALLGLAGVGLVTLGRWFFG